MKIALFCPNWVGDLLMATPALRAVRNRYVQAEITAIARPVLADVLAGTNLCDRFIAHAPGGNQPERKGLALWRRLRAEQFDLAVLFPNSLRSAWWAWSIGAKERVGVARNGRQWLLTRSVEAKSKRVPSPVMDEYARIALAAGATQVGRQIEACVTPEDTARWAAFCDRGGLAPEARRGFICFNTGGAFGPAKNWPVESFAALARRVRRELDRDVLVVCGPAEVENARAIAQAAKDVGVRTLADETPSLGLTKAAIAHAGLLVTTDSGPRFFAQAFNVPVVTLFGPTHIAWSETGYAKSRHLQVPLDCGPCQKRDCPLGHTRCMRNLLPDHVFAAVCELLAAQSELSPQPLAA